MGKRRGATGSTFPSAPSVESLPKVPTEKNPGFLFTEEGGIFFHGQSDSAFIVSLVWLKLRKVNSKDR